MRDAHEAARDVLAFMEAKGVVTFDDAGDAGAALNDIAAAIIAARTEAWEVAAQWHDKRKAECLASIADAYEHDQDERAEYLGALAGNHEASAKAIRAIDPQGTE